MANCRSCGAEIRWARTENGRNMPIEKDPNGNIVLEDGGSAPLAVVVPPDVAPERTRWISHFAKCPNAAAHRKKKR